MSQDSLKSILTQEISEPVGALKSFEVFRCGDYGVKGVFDEAALDQIAASYNNASKHEAPITLDHAKSGPAFGRIKRIWREGKKLLAEAVDVPARMIEAIQKGRYTKRSIELYDAEGGGSLFGAVTFLGAGIPHVKGMAEIAFADGPPPIHIDFNPVIRFAEVQDPDPSQHNVLVDESMTGGMMDHCHMAYTDAEGNGFTGPALRYDSDSYEYVSLPGGHQHAVRGGAIAPAGEIEHSHSLMLIKHTNGGTTAMSEKTTTEGAPTDAPAIDPKRFAELEEELKSAKQKIADSAKEIADGRQREREREADAAFSAVYSACFSEGRITPAEEPALKQLHRLLALTSPEPIKFGEAEKTPAAAFLDSLKARPKVVELGPVAKGGGGADRSIDFSDPEQKAKAVADRAGVIAEEKKITLFEASCIAQKEIENRGK